MDTYIWNINSIMTVFLTDLGKKVLLEDAEGWMSESGKDDVLVHGTFTAQGHEIIRIFGKYINQGVILSNVELQKANKI